MLSNTSTLQDAKLSCRVHVI